ncbi:DUF1294 domain-containing protein [Pseudomonas cavernicola]|uniref:DUF1294 domain-containing protein n=1 Tax=Pseudomonas cavernicola TaxID=2320866 RepID=A0A418X9N2_9PSED|nr:cold shock and DUF1294 domain-containing protein [Pseudomonas cavernicola]RJG09205.1 DUF1294 domain-containing protein [Pseudomonas cavernicola]
MEARGSIKSWNDDKGFGFITPEQGGAQVFVHISAMRGDRRPLPGDRVFFIARKDDQGRLRAEHMRLDGPLTLDSPTIRSKPKPAKEAARPRQQTTRPVREPSSGLPQNLGFKALLFAGLCLLPLLGSIQLLANAFIWPLCAYGLASLVTFCLYAHDKQSAEKGRWRTPESTLHIAELIGGWPGALVAQQVYRHKTRKASYQAVFWGIVLLHQVFWGDWLLFKSAYLGPLIQPWMGLLR